MNSEREILELNANNYTKVVFGQNQIRLLVSVHVDSLAVGNYCVTLDQDACLGNRSKP